MARVPLTLETLLAGEYPTRFNQRELKIIEALLEDENISDSFESALVWSPVDKAGTSAVFIDPTAEPAPGMEQTFATDKNVFERHIMAVDSTGTAIWSHPSVSADGLELTVDPNATDGITAQEISNGILSSSKCAYTVGSFPQAKPIFFEAKVTIDDISDLTELWAGFRKAEAYRVDPDSYDEMASFNIGKDGDGQIEIHTILNNGATSETDTTEADWTDGDEKTLRVEVANDGTCTFLLDGSEPAVTAAFSFDDGEVIVPFLAMTTETGDPGVSIATWKCGVK